MACAAAVRAVRDALPVNGGDVRRTPLRPVSAGVVFRRVGWWTQETLAEALLDLVRSGECDVVLEGDDVLFRLAPGLSARARQGIQRSSPG